MILRAAAFASTLLLVTTALAAKPADSFKTRKRAKGMISLEFHGKGKYLRQQADLLVGRRQLTRVGGEDPVGAKATPYIGLVLKAHGKSLNRFDAGQDFPLMSYKRIVLKDHKWFGSEGNVTDFNWRGRVHVDIKDKSLVVESGLFSPVSIARIEKAWDSGDAIGLGGLRRISKKVQQMRSAWQLFQPLSGFRVMLRGEVDKVGDKVAEILQGRDENSRDDLVTRLKSVGNQMLKSHRGEGQQTLKERLDNVLAAATGDELRVFAADIEKFVGQKDNRAGMADAFFGSERAPQDRPIQVQKALFNLSQMMNDKQIDVAANLSLAGNRASFVQYANSAYSEVGARVRGELGKPEAEKSKAGVAWAEEPSSKVGESIYKSVVRFFDNRFRPIRPEPGRGFQLQKVLIGGSQVMLRDEVDVMGQIGIGSSIATAAVDDALGALERIIANRTRTTAPN